MHGSISLVAVPRLYVPDFVADTATVSLPDGEAHHVTHVLRLKSGAPVRIFNGRGLEWAAHLVAVTKKSVEAAVDQEVTPVPEPAIRVTFAAGILKSDHMDALVRDATMMGAAEIVPLITEHVTVPAKVWKGSAAVERWHRVAVASAKQCGRAVVPKIFAPADLESTLAGQKAAMKLMFVEPSSGVKAVSVADTGAASALLIIGPEGGWSASELKLAEKAAVQLVGLGPRTIRADAMAVAALTAFWTVVGDSAPESSTPGSESRAHQPSRPRSRS